MPREKLKDVERVGITVAIRDAQLAQQVLGSCVRDILAARGLPEDTVVHPIDLAAGVVEFEFPPKAKEAEIIKPDFGVPDGPASE